MTPQHRLDRVERVLKLMIKAGDRSRREWREKYNRLVEENLRYGEEWRAEHRAMDEKINILIHTQMETSEQINRLAATAAVTHAKTEKTLDRLAASQVKTDRALRAYFSRRRKDRNEDS